MVGARVNQRATGQGTTGVYDRLYGNKNSNSTNVRATNS